MTDNMQGDVEFKMSWEKDSVIELSSAKTTLSVGTWQRFTPLGPEVLTTTTKIVGVGHELLNPEFV